MADTAAIASRQCPIQSRLSTTTIIDSLSTTKAIVSRTMEPIPDAGWQLMEALWTESPIGAHDVAERLALVEAAKNLATARAEIAAIADVPGDARRRVLASNATSWIDLSSRHGQLAIGTLAMRLIGLLKRSLGV
jgi:hypothetical protein